MADETMSVADRIKLVAELEVLRAELREQRELIEALLKARGIDVPTGDVDQRDT